MYNVNFYVPTYLEVQNLLLSSIRTQACVYLYLLYMYLLLQLSASYSTGCLQFADDSNVCPEHSTGVMYEFEINLNMEEHTTQCSRVCVCIL